MRLRWVGILALLAPAAAGCGDPKPELVPVRGHVFFRGAPLAGGAIVFAPDLEHGGRGPLACARIGDDGGYVLVTGAEPGAVAGWHRVTFQDRPAGDPSGARLPARYSDPEQSGQSCEVKPGQGNVLDFHLE